MLNLTPALCCRLAVVVLLSIPSISDCAILNVASWNMANKPNSAADRTDLATIFNYTGGSAGLQRPLDVLAMVEMDPTSAADVVAAAGSSFGSSTFTSVLSTPDGGSDRTGFVYNTSTLSLVNSTQLVSTSLTHTILRGRFRPVGTTGSDDFYMYAVHLKSGDGSAERATRLNEAGVIRADADSLGDANVILGGDFNWQGAHERGATQASAFTTLTEAGGTGQVFDPLNAVGEWHDNPEYLSLDTNAPGAAMDDRFDFQLISGELRDGIGLDYVGGTYTALGNNGTHTLNQPITTGTGAPPEVLAALSRFSDHLPIVAQYTFNLPEPTSILVCMGAAPLLRRRRWPAT